MTNRNLLLIGACVLGFLVLSNLVMLVIVVLDDGDDQGIMPWLVGEFDDPGILMRLEGTFDGGGTPIISSFATFVRESTSVFGYPTFIVLHTMGLSVVVGTSTIIGARILGFAGSVPLEPLGKLFPLMWAGFAVNTFSGSGLLLATASGQLTNPILLLKLTFVAIAVMCMLTLQVQLYRQAEPVTEASPQSKALAGAMLGCWMLAMIAGRLIAYAGVIIGR